ncbi:hypothetical protein [Streptomyces nigrescens]|uniref:hypothetical protein n=1 Tax=Streptomyces nigrescens TaxID=1920 RepID=UPI00347AF236
MAYALCTQAVIRAEADPRDARLVKAWRLMNGLWDPQARMWNEPGASDKRATFRAAHYTVSVYQEALDRLASAWARTPTLATTSVHRSSSRASNWPPGTRSC